MMTFLRWGHLAAVLLIGLAVLAVANGQCTLETCPPGPVMAYFQNPNCSGEPSFTTLSTIPGYHACEYIDLEYQSRNVTSEGLYTYRGTSSVCSKDSDVNFSELFWPFYVCHPQPASRSLLLLPNMTDPYNEQDTSIDLSYPNDRDVSVVLYCDGPDLCARSDATVEFWTTYGTTGPSGPTCDPSYSTAQYNLSYDGTCYRSMSSYYVTYECVDLSTTLIKKYIGEGCQHLFESEIHRAVCNENGRMTYHCKDTPVAAPLAPPTTPSAAPDSVPQPPSDQTTPTTPTSTTTVLLPSFLLIVVAILTTFI